MRCPKCHYLSFDPEPRCKSCGFSFSLGERDLSLKAAPDAGPPMDSGLRRDGAPAPAAGAARLARPAEPPAARPWRPSPAAAAKARADRAARAAEVVGAEVERSALPPSPRPAAVIA